MLNEIHLFRLVIVDVYLIFLFFSARWALCESI